MKTSKIVGVFVLVGLIVGCSTVGDLTGGMIGDFVTGDRTEDKDASGSDEGESEARSSDDGDVTDEAESPYDDMSGSLGMLPPAAAFQIVYAQTSFFTAGYAPASDYEPGEGVRWVLTWRDAEGSEDSIETEQALLSRDSAGSWWYISLAFEDYRIEYEFLVDASDTVVQIRYRDSAMSATEEAQVAVPFSVGMYAAYEENAASAGYRVEHTTERVTVPAGTWSAEKVRITGSDGSTGNEVDVTWWRVADVPGDTVRFEFVPVTDEDERYLGELQEFRDDYRSRL